VSHVDAETAEVAVLVVIGAAIAVSVALDVVRLIVILWWTRGGKR